MEWRWHPNMRCPETVVNFNGSTYKLNCGEFEFNQAEAFCKNQGGNLVTIETEEENNFLKNILTLMRNAGGASENLWWWIGLTDIKTDGSFEWISGQSVTYTDWYQGPPPEPNGVAWNNAKADCVVMRHTYGFTWSDEYCRYYDVQAICELW
ncbi:macrophage mannose receptor 1-like [Mytilus trossulus]|uniref:macrophage mannose receptor 1-like n=1 Tax=Mytilus trossulus TaxID=6551 RepID=UPI003005DB31